MIYILFLGGIAILSILLNYSIIWFLINIISQGLLHCQLSISISAPLGLIMILLPTAIALSKTGDGLLSAYLKLRSPSQNELTRLIAIIDAATKQLQHTLSLNRTNHNINNITTKITTVNEVRIYAIGNRILVISELALKHFSNNELQQKTISELYKLHTKSTALISAFYLSNWLIIGIHYLITQLKLDHLPMHLLTKLKPPFNLFAFIATAPLLLVAFLCKAIYRLFLKNIALFDHYANNHALTTTTLTKP